MLHPIPGISNRGMQSPLPGYLRKLGSFSPGSDEKSISRHRYAALPDPLRRHSGSPVETTISHVQRLPEKWPGRFHRRKQAPVPAPSGGQKAAKHGELVLCNSEQNSLIGASHLKQHGPASRGIPEPARPDALRSGAWSREGNARTSAEIPFRQSVPCIRPL